MRLEPTGRAFGSDPLGGFSLGPIFSPSAMCVVLVCNHPGFARFYFSWVLCATIPKTVYLYEGGIRCQLGAPGSNRPVPADSHHLNAAQSLDFCHVTDRAVGEGRGRKTDAQPKTNSNNSIDLGTLTPSIGPSGQQIS